MALCLVMMLGRIGNWMEYNKLCRFSLYKLNLNVRKGAVVGSNFVGAFLDGNCSAIFVMNSSLLLSD